MLKLLHHPRQLLFSQLMAVYEEDNRENGAALFPNEPEMRQLELAEEGFRQYLWEDFFQTEGAFYALWEEGGRYVSALRMEPYRDGLLLEALSTHPDRRRMGYGKKLIQGVQALPGVAKIYAHVGKKNTASQAIHKSCGFQLIADHAVYIDGSVDPHAVTFCWDEKG